MTAANASYCEVVHTDPVYIALDEPLTMDTLITYRINGCCESVQIQEQVYSVIRESRHTAVVIARRIYMVDSDSIRAQLGHLCCVQRALCRIEKRIVLSQLVSYTCKIVSI